ncbi:MAG: hypothetical protein K5705_14755 [Oscillospiraceae bacterium]|nr:hypothetical protein [Oscillospiraceae bacterium]MCR4761501.1 hypothetical protein [Oscillospiraceae bacterium]
MEERESDIRIFIPQHRTPGKPQTEYAGSAPEVLPVWEPGTPRETPQEPEQPMPVCGP